MDNTNVSPLPGGAPTDRIGGYSSNNTAWDQVFIGDQTLGTTNYESDPKDDTINDADRE
jgi:hypothetical protein